MEDKLIKNRLFLRKVVDSYVLHRIKDGILTIEGDSQYTIGGIEPFYKLSLKNCQAIELGYDLDELRQKAYEKHDKDDLSLDEQIQRSGGFLVGYEEGFQKALELVEHRLSKETEWQVEIVMDICGDKVYVVAEPFLDTDGCLILKRI